MLLIIYNNENIMPHYCIIYYSSHYSDGRQFKNFSHSHHFDGRRFKKFSNEFCHPPLFPYICHRYALQRPNNRKT